MMTPNKLSPHSTPCTFLGYPADHKGYRCFDLTTRKVITSWHVIFDESQFSFMEMPTSTLAPSLPRLPMSSTTMMIRLDANNPHASVLVHRTHPPLTHLWRARRQGPTQVSVPVSILPLPHHWRACPRRINHLGLARVPASGTYPHLPQLRWVHRNPTCCKR
jgi:hypothetical protein